MDQSIKPARKEKHPKGMTFAAPSPRNKLITIKRLTHKIKFYQAESLPGGCI